MAVKIKQGGQWVTVSDNSGGYSSVGDSPYIYYGSGTHTITPPPAATRINMYASGGGGGGVGWTPPKSGGGAIDYHLSENLANYASKGTNLTLTIGAGGAGGNTAGAYGASTTLVGDIATVTCPGGFSYNSNAIYSNPDTASTELTSKNTSFAYLGSYEYGSGGTPGDGQGGNGGAGAAGYAVIFFS